MTTTAATPVTYGDAASMARFSVARYQRMIEAGILTPEDKVELLENYVVLKMPRNPPHDSTPQRMLRPLLSWLPQGWDLRVQSAVALTDSQPEPDFALVRGTAEPLNSLRRIPSKPIALGILESEVVLRPGMTLIRRTTVPGNCYRNVPLDAVTRVIGNTKVELREARSLAGGTPKP